MLLPSSKRNAVKQINSSLFQRSYHFLTEPHEVTRDGVVIAEYIPRTKVADLEERVAVLREMSEAMTTLPGRTTPQPRPERTSQPILPVEETYSGFNPAPKPGAKR